MERLFTFFYLISFSAYCQWRNIGPGGEALSTVSFRNSTDGWIGGANGTLLRTFDGGSTWQIAVEFPAPHSTSHNRVLSVTTPLQYDVAVLAQQPSATEPTAVYYSTRNG